MGTVDDNVPGCPPAGGQVVATASTPPINVGLQAGVDRSGVIVANDRDRRFLAWLYEQIGNAAIEAAAAQFTDQRRPYVSNITRTFDIAIPSGLTLISINTVRARITALYSLVEKK